MSKTLDTSDSFVLFNYSMLDPKTDAIEIITGFENPALFDLLNGKIYLHVDASHCVVPKLFYQMLVIMAHYPQSNTFVPCMHVLMTGKQ